MSAPSAGPLAGLRVVELAGLGPAPFAAMQLANLGADVVRVERTDEAPDLAESVLLRGRRIVALDLKDDRGHAALLDLIDRADVLIEGFRPGVAERLGIGPDQCTQRNQRIVYGRMTGWGQSGPWSEMAGHDINYIAVTGVLDALGAPGEPAFPANLLGDFAGGAMFLVVGILSALWERERSGVGQVVDAAIVDGTAALASHMLGMRASGNWRGRGTNVLDGGAPFYGIYATADQKWLAVGALEPKFFALLCRVMQLDEVPSQYHRAEWPRLRQILTQRFAERTRDEWMDLFAGTDACVAPVLTFDEAMGHPQLASRATLTCDDDIIVPSPAPRFSRTPATPAAPANRDSVLAQVLFSWS